MISKIIASVVVVLAASAGVAYAATQLASSDGTQVCVNQTNGLMRAASTCREGEYPLTIGGGSDVVITQGTFTLDAPGFGGNTGGETTLPVTGITVSGYCWGGQISVGADLKLAAATGTTMDAIGHVKGAFGTQTLQVTVANAMNMMPQVQADTGTVIATSNGATATITVGAFADYANLKCKYIWQATEAPN